MMLHLDDKGKFYLDEYGNKYRRVTDVIRHSESSEGLVRWAADNGPEYCDMVLEHSGKVGSCTHKLIQGDRDLSEYSPTQIALAKVRHEHYLKFVAEWHVEILANEKQVWAPVFGVAGTMDALATVGNLELLFKQYQDKINPSLPWVLDWKTGRLRRTAACQASMYSYLDWLMTASAEDRLTAEMFSIDGKVHPSWPRPNVAVVSLEEDGWRFLPVEKPDRYIERFLFALKLVEIDELEGPYLIPRKGKVGYLKGL